MTNTKSNETLAKEQQNKKKQKELVDLECDDEFEEFNEEGIIITYLKSFRWRFEISLLSLVSFLFDRLCFVLCFARKNWRTLLNSLSLFFENRVDERKRGEGRRGAVGKRLGRHRRNGRFQDAFERGVEEERHQEINTNNERYDDDFFSVRGDCKDATRISAIVRHSARHGE